MTPTEQAQLQQYIRDRVEIDTRSNCWLWTRSVGSHGYGQGSQKTITGARMSLAHRLSYEAFMGPIPAGKQVDHLCRNKLCTNPAHLEPVSQQVNIRRQKGGVEDLSRCARGHEWDGRRGANGRPICLECKRAWSRSPEARERRRLQSQPQI